MRFILMIEPHSIFIVPPSLEEVERRLRDRGTETEKALEIRLKNARDEMGYKEKYDYLLVNDDLETAKQEIVEKVTDIIEGKS